MAAPPPPHAQRLSSALLQCLPALGHQNIDDCFLQAGRDVAGALLGRRGSHQTGGTYSTSTRRTTSDDVGFFRFTQLGPGVHVLDVRAEGYGRTQATHEPGVDPDRIEVWLEEL